MGTASFFSMIRGNLRRSLLTLSIPLMDVLLLRGRSYALSEDTTVKDVASDKAYHLAFLVRRLDKLLDQENDERRDFEKLDDYERRIQDNSARLQAFLERRYRLVSPPDRVILDWANSITNIAIDLPLKVRRERGGGGDPRTLQVGILLPPDKARLVKTFPSQVVVDAVFRFVRTRSIVVDSIDITLNGEPIYAD